MLLLKVYVYVTAVTHSQIFNNVIDLERMLQVLQ